MPSQRFETTLTPENPPSPLRSRKRVREITPTICPPLLSTFAAADDDDERPIQINSHEAVPSPAYIPDDVGFGEATLALESEQTGRQWASKCDAFDSLDGSSINSHSGSDALFSLYLRSPSPTEPLSDCGGETVVTMGGEDSSPDPLEKQMGQIKEKRHANPKARRIRLRIALQSLGLFCALPIQSLGLFCALPIQSLGLFCALPIQSLECQQREVANGSNQGADSICMYVVVISIPPLVLFLSHAYMQNAH
jgi:hypothetical protein